MRSVLLTILVLAGTARAQQAQPETPPTQAPPAAPPGREVEVTAGARMELGFNAGIQGSPGDVTLTRAAGTIAVSIPVGDRAGIDTGFRYELANYAFENATGIIPGTGDPWGSVNQESVFVRYGRQQMRQLAWFVGGTANWAGEEGADIGDSFTMSAFGGVRYWFSERFSIGFGLQYATRLEDSDLYLPFPTVTWEFAEHWRLSTEREPGRGVGLTLAYTPTPEWRFEVGGGYEPRQFRLDKDGPLPGGVVQDTAFPFGAGVTYTPSKKLTITGEAGILLGREFKVMDEGGGVVSEPDVDAAPFLGLRLTYRF
ncbi:MAG: hypothetical protein IT437_05470 [Phycisphaerales bacterium]|nr:hypothetical protein [Phycisphaerales bacterium]